MPYLEFGFTAIVPLTEDIADRNGHCDAAPVQRMFLDMREYFIWRPRNKKNDAFPVLTSTSLALFCCLATPGIAWFRS